MKKIVFWMLSIGILTACSPVKVPVTSQFQLKSYSQKSLRKTPADHSILITAPDSAAGYETSQMLYVKESFSLRPFANNSWVASPSSMLYPLMTESLQASGWFKVVATVMYAEPVEYRLDTQLLKLQQNFQHKPSILELSVKVVLTDMKKEKITASKIINVTIPCTEDTPYGGVIAANTATKALTAEITDFVIKGLNR